MTARGTLGESSNKQLSRFIDELWNWYNPMVSSACGIWNNRVAGARWFVLALTAAVLVALTVILVFFGKEQPSSSSSSQLLPPLVEEVSCSASSSSSSSLNKKNINPRITNPYPFPNSICSNLPQDLSTSYIWNEWVLPHLLQTPPPPLGHNNKEQQQQQQQQQQNLVSLISSSLLRRAVTQHPTHTEWGRLLQKLHHAASQQQTASTTKKSSSILQVWILTGPQEETVCQKKQQNGGSSSSNNNNNDDDDCQTWIQFIEQQAQQWFQSRSATMAIQFQVWSLSYGSTEFYTDWIQSIIHQQQQPSPDVILHAISRHDMEWTGQLEMRDPNSVMWEEERRHTLQHFIRTIRQASPDTVLLFLDDYIATAAPATTTTTSATPRSDQHMTSSPSSSSPLKNTATTTSLWVHEVNGRMLQELADYYQVGLVSYAQMVLRMVYADALFLAPLSSSSSSYNNMANNDNRSEDLYFTAAGNIAMAWSLLYSWLDYTNTYCFQHLLDQEHNPHEQSSTQQQQLIPVDIQYMVEHVLPPPLDAHQTLLTVSQEWQHAAAVAAASNKNESSRGCFYGVWSHDVADDHDKTTKPISLQTFLQPASVKQAKGWVVNSKGALQATQAGAILQWKVALPSPQRMSSNNNSSTANKNRIYAKVHIIQIPKNGRIKWTATSTQGEESMMVVDLDDSKNTMPLLFPVPRIPANNESHDLITFELQLLQGDSLQIVGLFVCL